MPPTEAVPTINGVSTPKILIVDDEPDIRMLLGVALGAISESVMEASDAYQAIDVARREQPDVIVLDAIMPGMSGPEAVPILREVAPGSFIALFSAITGGQLSDLGRELDVEVFPKTRIPDLIERISRLAGHPA